MANNQREEAWEVILKAAQMNGKPIGKELEMCQVGVCLRTDVLVDVLLFVSKMMKNSQSCQKQEAQGLLDA